MFKYIKETFTATVQVQSTSEHREGSQSNVPAPSAKVVYIGSRALVASAAMRTALPDRLW